MNRTVHVSPILGAQYQTLPMGAVVLNSVTLIPTSGLGFQTRMLGLLWGKAGARFRVDGKHRWSLTPSFSYTILGSSTLSINNVNQSHSGWRIQLEAMTYLTPIFYMGLDASYSALRGDVTTTNFQGALILGLDF